jgi:hypothetical protein
LIAAVKDLERIREDSDYLTIYCHSESLENPEVGDLIREEAKKEDLSKPESQE